MVPGKIARSGNLRLQVRRLNGLMSTKGFVAATLVLGSALVQAQRKPPKPLEPPSIAPLVVSRLLDVYAAGRFDDALREVAAVDDKIGLNLRVRWYFDALPWIDAAPAERPRRLLVAAALALETEHLRIERGKWGNAVEFGPDLPTCPGTCVLDWAQTLLVERGTPDAAERAWYLAAASLAGGVRDWRYLQRAIPVPQPGTRPPSPPQPLVPGASPIWRSPSSGLTERALLRFPGEPQLLLEQALAAAGRFTVTIDGGRLPSDVPAIVMFPPTPGGRGALPARPPQEVAISMLEALVTDPIVGAEAEMRLGYLRWALREDPAAKQHLRSAARRAPVDSDVRYVARFLLGWIAMQSGDFEDAAAALEAALLARPDSQSAALALATLELQRGDASKAYTTAQATIDKRKTDDDPWRLFLYGHHPLLKERIAALRAQVKP